MATRLALKTGVPDGVDDDDDDDDDVGFRWAVEVVSQCSSVLRKVRIIFLSAALRTSLCQTVSVPHFGEKNVELSCFSVRHWQGNLCHNTRVQTGRSVCVIPTR